MRTVVRRLRSRHPPFHDTIALMNRVATLMRAGVPTTRVFALATTEPGDLAALVTYASRSNQSISEAIAHVNTPAMRMFAALWHVAEVSGAPIAGATERAAASFELLDRLHQRRQVLLAGPKYTLYLVSLLPILAVLFGELLGFAPVAVLASPIGVPIILIGAIFLTSGIAWSRALVKKVAEADATTGFEFDLVAVALHAGLSLARARLLATDAIDQFRVEWAHLRAFAPDGKVSQVLEQAAVAGQPHGPALAHASHAAQNAAMSNLEEQAEKLAIRALIPLSVCILPAFAVLGILPIVISMLGLVMT